MERNPNLSELLFLLAIIGVTIGKFFAMLALIVLGLTVKFPSLARYIPFPQWMLILPHVYYILSRRYLKAYCSR